MVSRAYERTSLVVTTNLPFENWTEVLGSERLTGAMLDRLTHRVHILEANGESYRLRDAKKRMRRVHVTPPPAGAAALLFIGFRYAPADEQEARRRANALLTYANENASLRLKCTHYSTGTRRTFRPPFTFSAGKGTTPIGYFPNPDEGGRCCKKFRTPGREVPSGALQR